MFRSLDSCARLALTLVAFYGGLYVLYCAVQWLGGGP